MALFSKQEIINRINQKCAENPETRSDVNLALVILGSALFEKRLKSGEDYGLHPITVGFRNTRSIDKIIIGFLHDVVEDSDWTLDDLRTVGFSKRIVDGVDAMTHREGELYFDSIERCSLNLDAIDKKIEDLSHNMDASRLEAYTDDKGLERLNKYAVARAYLVSVKKEDIPPATLITDFVKFHPNFGNAALTQTLLTKYSSRSIGTQGPRGMAPAP